MLPISTIRRVSSLGVMAAVILLLWGPARPAEARTLSFPLPAAKSGDTALPAGRCVAEAGPAVPVGAVAFSHDGTMLATAGYREVLLWNLAEGKLAARLGSGQLDGSPHAVIFADQGQRLIAGSGQPGRSGRVDVFNTQSGDLLRTLEEPEDVVYALAVSPDGKLLAAGAADNRLYVWNREDGQPVVTRDEFQGWVLAVAFSPDGSLLATGSADRSAVVWQVDGWQPHARIPLNGPARMVDFTPNGRAIVGIEADNAQGTFFICNLPNPDQAAAYRPRPRRGGLAPGTATDAVVFPQANRAYAALSSGRVRVADSRNGRYVANYPVTEDWLYSAALSPDGEVLAVGSAEGNVYLWNTGDGKPRATLTQLAPNSDRWVIATAAGFCAASSPEDVRWRAPNGNVPPETLANHWLNAQRVAGILFPKKGGEK